MVDPSHSPPSSASAGPSSSATFLKRYQSDHPTDTTLPSPPRSFLPALSFQKHDFSQHPFYLSDSSSHSNYDSSDGNHSAAPSPSTSETSPYESHRPFSSSSSSSTSNMFKFKRHLNHPSSSPPPRGGGGDGRFQNIANIITQQRRGDGGGGGGHQEDVGARESHDSGIDPPMDEIRQRGRGGGSLLLTNLGTSSSFRHGTGLDVEVARSDLVAAASRHRGSAASHSSPTRSTPPSSSASNARISNLNLQLDRLDHLVTLPTVVDDRDSDSFSDEASSPLDYRFHHSSNGVIDRLHVVRSSQTNLKVGGGGGQTRFGGGSPRNTNGIEHEQGYASSSFSPSTSPTKRNFAYDLHSPTTASSSSSSSCFLPHPPYPSDAAAKPDPRRRDHQAEIRTRRRDQERGGGGGEWMTTSPFPLDEMRQLHESLHRLLNEVDEMESKGDEIDQAYKSIWSHVDDFFWQGRVAFGGG
ncbi:hypothetical protein IE53DRAFT_364362 [Violaceomyces palustris]|uniref:Uncharacterized protein n=1 Tax=Violaceomyces palustris TaxID=1673888 RepID=A0ACD0NPW7_9BASI|nr:hypothetical protein IE53DRAFT_364362 [Violaceomyces palustris]